MSGKTFKIIKIIDESTFIINAGYMDVEKNDTFRIIGNKTIPIKDPDTDRIIEELPTYKTYLTVEVVYDQVCICKTEWINGYNTGTLVDSLSSINMLKKISEGTRVSGHYAEVPINEEQIEEFNDHDDSPISLGDQAELVEKAPQSDDYIS